MTSFTHSGSFTSAIKWLPLAEAELSMMNRSDGLRFKEFIPAPNVLITIDGGAVNHIHIEAGIEGYEFSIHDYINGGDTDVFYFLDEEPSIHKIEFNDKEEGSPYQDSIIPAHSVQKNHINMWLGVDTVMTGCTGRRYGGGVGFTSGNMSDEILEQYPRYVESRELLWQGDEYVTAAARFGGWYIGVTMTGRVYRWTAADKLTENPVSGVECYWVFNKTGNECSGIHYDDYVHGEERQATIHTLKFSVDRFGLIKTEHSSMPAALGTYAVDYDYTEEANELISLVIKTSDRASYKDLPGDIEDWKIPNSADYYFMESFDISIQISRGASSVMAIDTIPFSYNYSDMLLTGAIPDPTDVSYKGQLLGLDLRYRAYCIASIGWISNKQYVKSSSTPTGSTNVRLVVNGADMEKGTVLNGSETAYIQDNVPINNGAPSDSYILHAPAQSVSRCQVPAVSPDMEAVGFFMRSSYTMITLDIDFLTGESGLFGSYHANIKNKLSASDDVLISTYSSWV